MSPTVEAQFWRRVAIGATDACWEWEGARNPAGYGYFYVPGSGRQSAKLAAHRAALETRLGRTLAPGEVARHRCDNPPCCNPAHLEPGSQGDNARDTVARGRHKGGARAGEANHQAKLTDAEVSEIRARLRFRAPRGSGSSSFDLAEEFGVSVHYLREVARGAERRHV